MSEHRPMGRAVSASLVVTFACLLLAGCVTLSGAPGTASPAPSSPASPAAGNTADVTSSPAPASTRRPCASIDTRPRCQTPSPAAETATAQITPSPTESPTPPPTPTPTPAPSALGGDLHLAPVNINFGNVEVSTTSAPVTVVVTNTGGDPFGPINMFGGAPPTDEFNASQSCQGATLPAAGTCEVSYTFTPSADGTFTDASSFTISETASQSDGFDFTITLMGCGVTGPIAIGCLAPPQR